VRILVTRLRFLGDIVLSTPLLDTLRERLPEATIEYLWIVSTFCPRRRDSATS
jgi:ADP-heptose:LPS heptosyltransferase